MKDYSYLEGKKVAFFMYDKSEIPFEGLIIGCDYDIGITIVDSGKHSRYLTCLNGPSSPLWPKEHSLRIYKKLFKLYIDMIEKGYVIYNEIYEKNCKFKKVDPTYWSIASSQTCSFGQ